MPKYNHDNWGDIANHIFAKGVITAVDSGDDTADVTVEGYQDGSGVPLFYHCEPDSEEASNGSIEGAAAAFSVDDEVIVMCTAAGAPVRIVGFVDGIKSCTVLLISLSAGSYRTVWDVAKGALATNVTDNDGSPVTFPVLASEITDWLATKTGASLDGLYGEESESDTGGIPPGSGSSTYEPYLFPCSGGFTATQNYAWTGVLGGANHVTGAQENAWSRDCDEGTGTTNSDSTGQRSLMRHAGIKLTAVNESAAVLKFYKSVSTELGQSGGLVHSHRCVTCASVWDVECESDTAEYEKTETVLSYTAYGLDLGVSSLVTTYSHVSCIGGTYSYAGDNPIIKSVGVSYSADYSENYGGAMIQLFSANDGRGNYSFYGQAESGIDDVNTQNPTALAETTGLTSAMQELSDLVGGSSVGASYYE